MNKKSFTAIDKYFSNFKKLYQNGSLKAIFTITSILFLSLSVIDNASQLRSELLSFNQYFILLISLLLTIISLFFNAFAWVLLLDNMNINQFNYSLIGLYLKTNLFKYLPGGIWHLAERFRILNKYIPSLDSLICVTLEPFLMLISSLVLISLGNFNIFLRILFISSVFLLNPKIIGFFVKGFGKAFISKLSKAKISLPSKTIFDQTIIFSGGYPFKSLFTELLFILIRFFGFWFCLKTFFIENNLFILNWISVFSCSWLMGLIIPGAPGGVGVFEASMILILGDSTSEVKLLASLLTYRLICTLSDLIVYFMSKNIPRKLTL